MASVTGAALGGPTATPRSCWANALIRAWSSAVIVASAADTKSDWVRAGQVFGRLALTMTSMGIKLSLMNQPIEGAAVRRELQGALGLGAVLPQMLVRFGHSGPMPLSERRPVDRLLVNGATS